MRSSYYAGILVIKPKIPGTTCTRICSPATCHACVNDIASTRVSRNNPEQFQNLPRRHVQLVNYRGVISLTNNTTYLRALYGFSTLRSGTAADGRRSLACHRYAMSVDSLITITIQLYLKSTSILPGPSLYNSVCFHLVRTHGEFTILRSTGSTERQLPICQSPIGHHRKDGKVEHRKVNLPSRDFRVTFCLYSVFLRRAWEKYLRS